MNMLTNKPAEKPKKEERLFHSASACLPTLRGKMTKKGQKQGVNHECANKRSSIRHELA
jgi:hypothetical protein